MLRRVRDEPAGLRCAGAECIRQFLRSAGIFLAAEHVRPVPGVDRSAIPEGRPPSVRREGARAERCALLRLDACRRMGALQSGTMDRRQAELTGRQRPFAASRERPGKVADVRLVPPSEAGTSVALHRGYLLSPMGLRAARPRPRPFGAGSVPVHLIYACLDRIPSRTAPVAGTSSRHHECSSLWLDGSERSARRQRCRLASDADARHKRSRPRWFAAGRGGSAGSTR